MFLNFSFIILPLLITSVVLQAEKRMKLECGITTRAYKQKKCVRENNMAILAFADTAQEALPAIKKDCKNQSLTLDDIECFPNSFALQAEKRMKFECGITTRAYKQKKCVRENDMAIFALADTAQEALVAVKKDCKNQSLTLDDIECFPNSFAPPPVQGLR
jgi:hypothetical protein